MADYDFPADLLDAQRAYSAADARVQEVTAALPSSLAIVAGEAAVSDEQRQELVAARTERLDRLDTLNAHPWWGTVDDRHDAWMQLQKAARS